MDRGRRGLLAATLMAVAAQAVAAPVDAATRREVVNAAAQKMRAHYVFPEVAERVAARLDERLAQGAYERYDDAEAFARQLTADIREVTRDLHIRVRYSAEPVPERAADAKPLPEEITAARREAERLAFGVERVERLPLNIGYIELRGFESLAFAGEAIAAAFTLVAHCDALIVDLRRNGGGDPATVSFASSYLFDERTHLNTLYQRQGDRTDQYWTSDWVPGRRFGGGKPVYVLTSKDTFSGAEEFSYNLKTRRRATLIGETTGGGANPGDVRRLSAHFAMFVPDGRAINPITGTNWEGTGVEPDVKVPADDALRMAQLLAAKALQSQPGAAESPEAYARRIAELQR